MENYTAPNKVENTEPKVVGVASEKETVHEIYRSHAVLAVCHHCNKAVPTVVTTKCSASSYLCFCFCGGCWGLYQMYKRKDLNCCDASHSCSTCNQPLGTYNAC